MAGGRESGVKNYKKPLLLDIIKEVLPAGAEAWKLVAQIYWQRSQEPTLRDYNDVKTQFLQKMVNTTKKVTGYSEPAMLTRRANEVFAQILHNQQALDLGRQMASDDSDEEDYNREPETVGNIGEDDVFADILAGPTQHVPMDPITPVAPPMVQQDTSRKRTVHPTSEDNKSKNCRNSNPRATAATAINNVVAQIGANSQNNQMMQFMQMMMQQQQQQAAQQNNLLMMLLMNRGSKPSPPSAPLTSSASVSSFNTGTTDSTGDVSMDDYEIAHHFD